MKDFRRPSGQGAGRGGFDKREQSSDFRAPRTGGYQGSNERPGYGSHKGDHNSGERREQKFQATCSECNKTCEVPFRPNGSKPVYCKDCFGAKKGAAGPNNDRFDKRDFGGHAHPSRDERPAQAPQQRDSRIDELKSQVDSMQSKLDRIIRALEGNKTVAEARTFEKPAAMAKVAEKLAVMPKPMEKPAAKAQAKPMMKAAAKMPEPKKSPAKKEMKKAAPAKKIAAKPVAKKKK